MTGVKDAVMELARHLSAESTWDEVMDQTYVLQKIERGLKDADEGRTVAHEAADIQADPVPLRAEASGALRVGDTRVLLELVIRAFEDGATPKTIVQRYTTLKLSDVYAVLAYYLRHRGEVEDYLRRRERQAVEVSERINSTRPDLGEIRRRLGEKRAATERDHAPAGE